MNELGAEPLAAEAMAAVQRLAVAWIPGTTVVVFPPEFARSVFEGWRSGDTGTTATELCAAVALGHVHGGAMGAAAVPVTDPGIGRTAQWDRVQPGTLCVFPLYCDPYMLGKATAPGSLGHYALLTLKIGEAPPHEVSCVAYDSLASHSACFPEGTMTRFAGLLYLVGRLYVKSVVMGPLVKNPRDGQVPVVRSMTQDALECGVAQCAWLIRMLHEEYSAECARAGIQFQDRMNADTDTRRCTLEVRQLYSEFRAALLRDSAAIRACRAARDGESHSVHTQYPTQLVRQCALVKWIMAVAAASEDLVRSCLRLRILVTEVTEEEMAMPEDAAVATAAAGDGSDVAVDVVTDPVLPPGPELVQVDPATLLSSDDQLLGSRVLAIHMAPARADVEASTAGLPMTAHASVSEEPVEVNYDDPEAGE